MPNNYTGRVDHQGRKIYRVKVVGFDKPQDVVRHNHGVKLSAGCVPCMTISGLPVSVTASEFETERHHSDNTKIFTL